jgi:6-phosphogluconolactonase
MKSFRLFFVLVLGATSVFGEQESFYLGTYTGRSSSHGIYRGSLDSVTGKLGAITLAAATIDPSFLALSPDGQALFAANELPGAGRVQAFRRADDGSLVELNRRSAGGEGTCHVSVDPSGRDLLVANYGSGIIACFQIRAGGKIGWRTARIRFTGSGPDADRQQGPHAHCVYASPDDAFIYSCDLGSDRIWIFKFDAARGRLVANDPPWAQVPPGSGPRHLVFSRDGAFLYVANELGHSVTVFARNSSTGKLTPLQTIVISSGKSDGKISAAEIALHPSGRWLYVSCRGSDTLSVFAVRPSGRLRLVQGISAEVKSPRSFAIDPSGRWIIAAGQDDNRIAVLRIDARSGELVVTAHSARLGSPVCVLFGRKS